MPFLSKAVQTAAKPSAASKFISTNAAIDSYRQVQLVQDFRDQFWKAAIARSARRSALANDEAVVLPVRKTRVVENASPKVEGNITVQEQLQKCAREDLMKHFRMSATSRAMKRGDGVMSDYFSLNDQFDSVRHQEDSNASRSFVGKQTELPSLIDVSTARKAREEMHDLFWSSYQAREDRRNAIKVRSKLHTSTSVQHAQNVHVHEHQIKLPISLHAYFELGRRTNNDNYGPRPMAITEIDPPFRIVDVNHDWTKLCGYTRQEAIGCTIKELLQGPETNEDVATDLVSSLMHHNEEVEHEAVLINYRSNGRMFKNHVRIGRIKDEEGNTTHVVGLFRKLSDDDLSTIFHEDLYANA
eukprot:CAMPEP_0183707096 /NCGR_PEP_ID=MMETSP0737-20130205/3755_1 /TAXON_ID=385413 /ORGANISM="Thalassiosira miniscula, Strain CCMP1093" /LENGTH=356 /DNA_ID=CAMNT_0025934673 /DNA_START=113 /DNA_END=1183 /DNA_ORIENTATION=+